MTTNQDWEWICNRFCKQNNYTLVFVNDNDFGFMDSEENVHHLYADELFELLKNKKESEEV